jgi:hypothetical protein
MSSSESDDGGEIQTALEYTQGTFCVYDFCTIILFFGKM